MIRTRAGHGEQYGGRRPCGCHWALRGKSSGESWLIYSWALWKDVVEHGKTRLCMLFGRFVSAL